MTKFIVNNRTDALKTDVNLFFTITDCRISRSRSLTRRTNFKFMCLSAYGLTIKFSQWARVNFCSYCKINKLTSVFYASVLLLIMNFVITLSRKLWIHEAIAEWIRNVMTKFIVNNRTGASKTDINLFFTITNCRISRSRSLTRRMNFKFMCLSVFLR